MKNLENEYVIQNRLTGKIHRVAAFGCDTTDKYIILYDRHYHIIKRFRKRFYRQYASRK